MYQLNHYILIVENTFTKQTTALDVYNVSGNKSLYRFDDVVFPNEFPSGTYNWYLIYDLLDYTINFSNDIMESTIVVNPVYNKEMSDSIEIPIKYLFSEFGILEYIKDVTDSYEFINSKQNYHSL